MARRIPQARRIRRRSRISLFAPVFILGLVIAVVVWSQLTPPAESPIAENERADEDGLLALLDDEAPQSVEDPVSEFEALASPAPEALPRRDQPITYTIRVGDTLLTIAGEFGLRAETLTWANSLANPDLIVTGNPLRIPPIDGLFHTIRPGDALNALAERYGLDLAAVTAQNGIGDPDEVEVGMELFMPGARPLAPGGVLAAGGVGAPDPLAAAAELLPLPDNLDDILSAGWLRVTNDNVLFNGGAANARRIHALPTGVRLERVGGLIGRRVQVRDPGDGRTRQAMTGWVDVGAVDPGRAPSPRELPRAYPHYTRMDISHVFVPYRTQLDGGPWALANCGPTSLSMVLETFGIERSPAQLRPEVLSAQNMYGNYIGTLLSALATVGEKYGIQPVDLYEGGK